MSTQSQYFDLSKMACEVCLEMHGVVPEMGVKGG